VDPQTSQMLHHEILQPLLHGFAKIEWVKYANETLGILSRLFPIWVAYKAFDISGEKILSTIKKEFKEISKFNWNAKSMNMGGLFAAMLVILVSDGGHFVLDWLRDQQAINTQTTETGIFTQAPFLALIGFGSSWINRG
jgi:hypothetical protein